MRISDWSSDVCSSDLLVDAADLDRRVVRRLDLDALGHREIDIVAVPEVQLQSLALRVGAIADAGDLEHLGEALGHARDQVLHQRALHPPERARFAAVVGGPHRDRAVADLFVDEVGKRHCQRDLWTIERTRAAADTCGDTSGVCPGIYYMAHTTK